MRKILIFLLMFSFTYAFSQCVISGAQEIQVGEKQMYVVENPGSFCADCFVWSYDGENLILDGDSKTDRVSLKGSVPGEAVLNVEIKGENGKQKCQKMIQIISPKPVQIPAEIPKCEIALDDIKEIRVSDNKVRFEAVTTEGKMTYKWKVLYKSGQEMTSTDEKPLFPFSNEQAIDTVELEVVLNKCTKVFSKMYDTNFWYFF